MRSDHIRRFVAALALIVAIFVANETQARIPDSLREIQTEPGALREGEAHVQGICCNDDAIFAVFMNRVFKLDWSGKILKSVPAAKHSGDACLANDRLYVSMSTQDGVALCEYDQNLKLLRNIKLENCPACDGIAYLNGRFYIGGPSTAKPHLDNLVLVYDDNFNFVGGGFVNYGVSTKYGPQSITAADGKLFFSFYLADDAPEDSPTSVWVDCNLKTLGTSTIDGSNGWTFVPKLSRDQTSSPNGVFLVAQTVQVDGETVAKFRWFRFNGETFNDVTEK